MTRIAILGCSKMKAETACKTRNFYKGALFKKSLEYIEPQVDKVLVLSGLYGLVEIDGAVAPYEYNLYKAPIAERKALKERVAREIQQLIDKGATIIYLLNDEYQKGLPPGEAPLHGMRLGPRLQWLNNKLKERKNAQEVPA